MINAQVAATASMKTHSERAAAGGPGRYSREKQTNKQHYRPRNTDRVRSETETTVRGRRDLTVNAGEQNPGVVVRDHVSVAVLWFVDLQVGILPCELLARVNRLEETKQPIRTITKHDWE